MSLMLVQMNEPESLALTLGRQGFLEARNRIAQDCRDMEHPQRACLPYGEVGFLVILSDCERQTAVHLGQSADPDRSRPRPQGAALRSASAWESPARRSRRSTSIRT